MARRRTLPEPQAATLTTEDMRAAIPTLQRRIVELEAIDVETIQERGEPRLDALEQKVDSTLTDLFGHDSIEHRRFGVMLDTASINMAYGTPIQEVQAGYKRGINQAISNLQTIIELFEEKIEDKGDSPVGRAMRAFSDLDLHPEISRAVSKLFLDGHYANAIEDSCKVLDAIVKLRSGIDDRSGTELMQAVFSPKNPVLQFSGLSTESERSEQQGMMFLYSGAMLAFRNPRAHELMEDDPERALEYIAFISLLAKSLDDATRV